MSVPKKEIIQFQKKILSWYEKNKRDLPWRDIPVMTRHSGISFRDPYAILVSEVMSQQTQISRVVPKYRAWMERFPTVESLVTASTRDVLQYWSGLGYNRRALYLKKCAEELVGRELKTSPQPRLPRLNRGKSSPKRRGRSLSSNLYWPQTEKELRALPGIGEYTARALLCFAFDQQIAVVDTNVRKVIVIHWKLENGAWKMVREGRDKTQEKRCALGEDRGPIEAEIRALAEQLVPRGRAYEWNQALMDYAAALLRPLKVDYKRARQSKFEDSDRYYRGQILKYLLEQQTGSVAQLLALFKAIPTMNEARLQRIITSLVKDKLVWEDSKKMVLSLEE